VVCREEKGESGGSAPGAKAPEYFLVARRDEPPYDSHRPIQTATATIPATSQSVSELPRQQAGARLRFFCER